jgi:hypothetical protein
VPYAAIADPFNEWLSVPETIEWPFGGRSDEDASVALVRLSASQTASEETKTKAPITITLLNKDRELVDAARLFFNIYFSPIFL